jgi:hypothetical protein
MEVDVGNELPPRFLEKYAALFPNPWPLRSLPPGSHKTPDLDSDRWKAVMNFKNSGDWKAGDLQRFANYFDVGQSALSLKIKKSQRNLLAAEGAGSSQGDPLHPPPSTLPPCSPPVLGGED